MKEYHVPCVNMLTGAAGVAQIFTFGYGGLRYEADALRLAPRLPPSPPRDPLDDFAAFVRQRQTHFR